MENTLIKTLAVVSIIGFLVNAVDAFTNITLVSWMSGISYIALGIGLVLVAGGKGILKIYEDKKVTNQELADLLTAMMGLASFFIGVTLFPIELLSGLNFPYLAGIRGVVSIFAALAVAIDVMVD